MCTGSARFSCMDGQSKVGKGFSTPWEIARCKNTRLKTGAERFGLSKPKDRCGRLRVDTRVRLYNTPATLDLLATRPALWKPGAAVVPITGVSLVHTRATSKSKGRFGSARALGVTLLVTMLCGCTGAGPTVAQSYKDLDETVTKLVSRLVANGRLQGKEVLVRPHDFYEQYTERNLPLSAILCNAFRDKFEDRDVSVLVLAGGSEDDSVIFQGTWHELPEPSVKPGTKDILLTVKLMEQTEDGDQRLLGSERSRINGVADSHLTPDAGSWGRHMVKQLEIHAKGSGRRIIRVGDFDIKGESAESERARDYLSTAWLLPAFTDSRRFQLTEASDGDGGSTEGELDVTVWMHSKDMEITLKVQDDQGKQVSAVSEPIPKELFDIFSPAAEKRRQAEEERRRIAELAPEMVGIAGGCFQMGSPGSEKGRFDDERRHRVCVEDFSIGKYEVTVREFSRFVKATGYRTDAERNAGEAAGCFSLSDTLRWEYVSGRSWRSPGFDELRGYRYGEDHPVVCVSWTDAQAYVKWLSGETGEGYRLATEAEWEYAARAGTRTARPWGDAPEDACKHANVADLTESKGRSGDDWSFTEKQEVHKCKDGSHFPAPVKTYVPNRHGLHNMLGNVWEWTCSEYDRDYGGAEQRCAAAGSGDHRVRRGGSWNTGTRWVRSADRVRGTPDDRSDNIGFRLVRD